MPTEVGEGVASGGVGSPLGPANANEVSRVMSSKFSRGGRSPSGRRFASRRAGVAVVVIAVLFVGVIAIANFAPRRAAGPTGTDGVGSPAPGTDSESGVTAGGSAGARTDEVESTKATAEAALDLPNRPIVPANARVAKPRAVRGLYLNAWAAGSTKKLEKLLDIADRTEINTFVIDVKEGGEISYPTAVRLAAEIGADQRYIPDVQGTIAKLKARGVYPIARIVVFKDEMLAKAKPEWAIQKADGTVWKDNHGNLWVDSFNKDVWDYNIAIAREAIELGFSEVQWDYVRFPDVPRSYMRTAVWPARAGRQKEDAIREFLNYSREQLADLSAPVTADVFGLTTSAENDMGIGQLWDKMVDATDVLLPMVYPSHYARGSYGIAYPNAQPYDVIRTSLRHAVRRTEGVPNAALIRPWLQDFTLGRPRYGPAHVRAQISAVYDAGLEEWVLWNPGSNYTLEALANSNGVAPKFERPNTVAPVKRTSSPDAEGRLSTSPSATAEKAKPKIWGMPVKRDSTKTKPDTTKSKR